MECKDCGHEMAEHGYDSTYDGRCPDCLYVEVERLRRWAGYCHSCALSGKEPMSRERFDNMPANRAAEAAETPPA